jgi:Anti-sigma factor NepR
VNLLQPWMGVRLSKFRRPQDMKPLEQSTGHLVSEDGSGTPKPFEMVRRGRRIFGHNARRPLRPMKRIVRGAEYPREGDERLSAKRRSDSDHSGRSKHSKSPPADKKARKQRSSDLGRALRSIYDDTLREAVPDDFTNLIGKLS